MITDLIVGGFLSFIATILSWLPEWDFPSLDNVVPGSLASSLGSVDNILPLLQIMLIFAAYLSVRLALIAWDGIVWVYHQFWGSS